MKFIIIINKEFKIKEVEQMLDFYLKSKGENVYWDSLGEKMRLLKKYIPFIDFELLDIGEK